MRKFQIGRESQFKLALAVSQGVGFIQAVVFVALIGPGLITDNLTLLILLAQAPISILSFGALYGFVIGNPNFNSWALAKILVAPFGALAPLLIFPFASLSGKENKPDIYIIVCFCLASFVNVICSIDIVRLACSGNPNWLAYQSMGNSLAISVAYIMPFEEKNVIAGLLLVLNSIFVFWLVQRNVSRVSEPKIHEKFEINQESKLQITLQVIRSLVGYLGPIFLLIAISQLEAGTTTVVAIINRVVQSLINLTANPKVHTSKIDMATSESLENISKKYLIWFSATILLSKILQSNFATAISPLILAAQLWAAMCLVEIVHSRIINLRASMPIIKAACLGGILGFAGSYYYLHEHPSIKNFYMAYSVAILGTTILPSLLLLNFRNRILFTMFLAALLCILSINYSLLICSLFGVGMYVTAKWAEGSSIE